MPSVRISAEAQRAIRAQSTGELARTEVNEDGSYDIWLSRETIFALNARQFACESLSDVIVRVCAVRGAKGLN